MPILDIQKRARELGRIRLGQKQQFTRRDGSTGTKPVKLDRFRLTSGSEALLDKVAELYGGEVHPWTPDGGSPQFEIVTDARRLPILVPPQPITQWYEAWRKSGCVHRCDGRTNVLTDELCDPEDPLHQEATEKPTTRLNVVLRDVEGIGVWRVETKGWHAAVELPDVAEFLAQAGGYVNGWLALEQRTSIDTSGDKPVTQHFMVPIIEIDVTPAELMAGKGRIAAPALEGPVPAQKAIASGPAAEQQPANGLSLPTEDDIAGASLDGLRAMWKYLDSHGALNTNDLGDKIMARVQHLQAAEKSTPAAQSQPDTDGVVDAEIVPDASGDADAVWQQVLKVGGELGMGLKEVTGDFEQRYAMNPSEASAGELAAYLQALQVQAAKAEAQAAVSA